MLKPRGAEKRAGPVGAHGLELMPRQVAEPVRRRVGILQGDENGDVTMGFLEETIPLADVADRDRRRFGVL